MNFLNRISEQEQLNLFLNIDKPSFIVIYGRRRCGKSRLIQQVLKKGDIYYQADRQEPAIQREQLVQTISEILGMPYEANFRSWESLLIDLNRVLGPNQTLAIDEFPYILKNETALSSVLQRLIDGNKLKYNLIICGSAQNVMSEMVQNGSEPLYGRADVILKIRPLAPGWIQEGLQLSPEESIREYAVWGGIPRYWELRSNYKNLEAALAHLVFSRDAILLEEPMRLLLDDLRSAVQPYTILTLIGQGVHRPSEIAGRLEKSLPGLADSFQKLIELGFIRREIPFGESIRSSKRTLYKISDPFMAFYFRFVLPNKQRIEMGLGEQVLKQVFLQLDEYVAGEWEYLCRIALPMLKIKGKQWDIASRWWGTGKNGKETELDGIVLSTDKTHILYSEVKWSQKTDFNSSLKQLNNSIDNCKKFADATIVKVLCNRLAMNSPDDLLLVLPEDILRVLR
jgi:AAA+ ATPase superfamily predicted ATPase